MTKKKQVVKKKKEPIWLWVIMILFGVFLYGIYYFTAPPTSLKEKPTQAVLNLGMKTFQKNCAACHGVNAVGEDPKRPKGGSKPLGGYLAPALNGSGHSWHHPNEMLFNTVKNGSAAKDSPMRGFKEILSDGEMIASIQYFKSLWPERIQKSHRMNAMKH